MDLKGAKIRNIYRLCQEINNDDEINLSINIPYYQRPYKWSKKQIDNLFKDFVKNKSIAEPVENKTEYFVGSVVTVKYHDIIDGQQRITTVFLLNYFKFLLIRAYIEELLMSENSSKIDGALKNIEKCYSRLLGTNNIKRIKEMHIHILEKIEDMENGKFVDTELVWNQILDYYRDTLFLPVKDFDNEILYKSQHEERLKSFFENEDFALKYSRGTYNEKLKRAMYRVGISLTNGTGPKLFLTIDNDTKEQEDKIVIQYIDALEYIYHNLEDLVCGINNPIKRCNKMIEIIDEMLDNLKFCVIVTGNDRDAYTLFEVLNDRALEVDDLDLIKNLFFKKYCTLSGEDDNKIDQNIEDLDGIWGNEIFANIGVEQTKLIAYLGTVYLTADENVVRNQVQRYREIIELKYFDEIYQGKAYKRLDIYNDFKILQMVRIITDRFEFAYQKKAEIALKAECLNDKSITFRTMHLLNALNYAGVLPAITNLIIRSFINENAAGGQQEINTSKFEDYIDDLINSQSENDPKYEFIHSFACDLWTSVLLAKDYSIPRDIAKKVIENVNIVTDRMDGLEITARQKGSLEEEYQEWTNNWQYGKDDIKIKILFLNLLKTDKDNNQLKYKAITSVFKNYKAIQLDHLEANNIEDSFIDRYFQPNDTNDNRNNYVSSLGNFMLLDETNNNNKNNKPLWNALDYYNNLGNHWLIQEIKEMMNDDTYSKELNNGTNARIPNEKFFNERKKRLQNYFLAILNRDKDSDVVRL